MNDNSRQTMLVAVLSAATIAAFNDIFRDMAGELRRYSGRQFDHRVDALEARALKRVTGVALRQVPPDDRAFVIEQIERIIGAAFDEVRARGAAVPVDKSTGTDDPAGRF